ncbi:MAG: glutathione S-transferase [Chroococcidiopsidaceae cyanobacterium CP_BM_ER_R8_30]|nr:glutathione S-transferase [Chroococcidiopsidaceae cyanobacterium CP_BM_ER_R8_30]
MLPSSRLITFPVSHYCEKARWALERLNIPYIEERHAPLFHLMATRRVGGSSVPVLILDGKVLTDSTEILKYLDTIAPDDRKLYPLDSELLKQVEELETLFNTKLGTSTRIWAYSYTLDRPQLSKRRFTYRVPFYEQVLFPAIFPLVSSKIRQKLHITPETTTAAYDQIINIFAGIGDLLKDGRRYLVGNRFSAADLTFAALSVAAVRPPEYGDSALALSNLEQLPPKMAEQVCGFREMPAGAFALRLWRERAAKQDLCR